MQVRHLGIPRLLRPRGEVHFSEPECRSGLVWQRAWSPGRQLTSRALAASSTADAFPVFMPPVFACLSGGLEKLCLHPPELLALYCLS